MSPNNLKPSTVQQACLNNPEAIDFLTRWSNYVHSIDDIEDTAATSEFRLKAFIQAMEIYTHPFFLKHGAALKQIVYNATSLYADSLECEKSAVDWHQRLWDWARHSGVEMVLAVACIIGGYDHMRSISMEFRKLCYFEHHDEKGQPR